MRSTRKISILLACLAALALSFAGVRYLLDGWHASLAASHRSALAAHPERDPAIAAERQHLLASIPTAAIPSSLAPAKTPLPQSSLAPVTFAPTTGGRTTPAPVSISKSPLTVGQPAPEDTLDFALHPSHYADPSRMVSHISLAAIPREPSASAQSLAAATQPAPRSTAPLTPYEEACRLENARRFVMSMCTDLQGRIWIGSEEDAPGTGGVQCFDPSKPPLEAFTQYTTKDGLGDNNGYAVACDKRGRIWVGHLNHGVSVFNGEKWRNYEVVGGLSREDTLSGPLGERVFRIATNTENGDVWMATSCGLARYNDSKDTWNYYTRADGLPSDQANALAIAKDGTVYVGTQCDGIAIGTTKDEYKDWRRVDVPDGTMVTASGNGQPATLINDILIGSSGTLYVATSKGLAWSKDRGESWQYLRATDEVGKFKPGDKAAVHVEASIEKNLLSEDFVTSLAEILEGTIVIGHPSTGADILDVNTFALSRAGSVNFPTSLLPLPTHHAVLSGSYGSGMGICTNLKVDHQERRFHDVGIQSFPSGQTAQEALNSLPTRTALSLASKNKTPIAIMGEDWITQGDWVGRYGRQYSNLCASNSPFDDTMALGMVGMKFSVKGTIGIHAKVGDSKRNWLSALRSDDPSAPYNPFVGYRRDGQWDDHGEAYPKSWDGPGLLVTVTLPEGLYRLSLYFYDGDAHNHALEHRVARDFYVLARLASDEGPPLACTRVQHFAKGVYKQFLVQGNLSYVFEIQRQSSVNTMLSAIYIDRLAGPVSEFDDGPLGCMGHVHYDQPYPPSSADLPSDVAVVASRWISASDEPDIYLAACVLKPNNIFLYRGVSTKNPTAQLLDAWRWTIPLWTPNDRRAWAVVMQSGWLDFLNLNPSLKKHAVSENINISRKD